MDFSKLIQHGDEEEIRVKTLLELSTRKYNLQKELESLKVKLSVKQDNLKRLENEVISLKFEVPVLEKQEEVAKKTAEDLMRQFVVKKAEIENMQELVWAKINKFVADGNSKLATAEKNSFNTAGKSRDELREDKIRQLKLESEIEAMQSFEKYQNAKIGELKLIKELLENDSFAI